MPGPITIASHRAQATTDPNVQQTTKAQTPLIGGHRVVRANAEPLPSGGDGFHPVRVGGYSLGVQKPTVRAAGSPPSEVLVKSMVDTAKSTRDYITPFLTALQTGSHDRQRQEIEQGCQQNLALLSGQVANARQDIALIFKSEGKAESSPSHELSPENMKLVDELQKLIDENLRILNFGVELFNPSTKLMADNMKDRFQCSPDKDKEYSSSYEEIAASASANFQEYMDRIVPDSFKSGTFRRNLRGDEATRQMHQLAWEFSKLLRESPDMRTALGGRLVFSTPAEREDFIERFVDKLRLSCLNKSEMKEMLMQAMGKELPAQSSVTVGRELGAGGNGKVFEGTFNGRPVVVKKLHPPQTFGTNVELNHELMLHGRVSDNPNIPKFIGIFYDDDDAGTPCIVMDKVDGGKSKALLDKYRERLSGAEQGKVGLHMFGGVVHALATMSQQGYMHRDIKPDNIMFDKNTFQARLIDFGTAGPMGNHLGHQGTPNFIAPEANTKEERTETPQSDVFSLGSTLYEIVGGKTPWSEVKTLWELSRELSEGKPPGQLDTTFWSAPEMTPVKELIIACWSMDPNARPTIGQMQQALRGDPVTSAPDGQAGLKAGKVGVLDVLRPEHPLRQDPEGILRGLLSPVQPTPL